jgi:hypothetical protein
MLLWEGLEFLYLRAFLSTARYVLTRTSFKIKILIIEILLLYLSPRFTLPYLTSPHLQIILSPSRLIVSNKQIMPNKQHKQPYPSYSRG